MGLRYDAQPNLTPLAAFKAVLDRDIGTMMTVRDCLEDRKQRQLNRQRLSGIIAHLEDLRLKLDK